MSRADSGGAGARPTPDKRRRIAYVATRDLGYARNAIVGRALGSAFEVDTIASAAGSYWARIPIVILRLVGAWLTRRHRCWDAVFVGFLAQPILPFVRLLWRGPLVSDAYLSVYDTLVSDRQVARPGSVVSRVARWLDRYMLQESDLAFTDTESHAEFFRRLAQPKGKLIRLLASAEAEALGVWQPIEYRAGEAFNVLFWGAFIPLQGVDVIVRAASLLSGENVHFTLVGAGQTYADCVSLRAALRATNVELLGWQTQSEIAQLAQRSHLALGIFGTSDKAARVIPNKVFEALKMGMPVVTGASRAVRELLTDADVLTAEMGTPEALAERIRFARDHYPSVLEMATHGHEKFWSTASSEQVASRLVAAMQELLDSTR
jgi:glycosyltransferase involved in cell wall biosynthesis